MLDPKIFDDISKRVAGSIPQGLQSLQNDLQRNLHSSLEATFSRLNLVTREEFDIQQAVLLRTREKLDLLEKELQVLEKQRQKVHNSI